MGYKSVVHVNTQFDAGTANIGTVTVTKPTGLAVGDLMLAFMTLNLSGLTPPSGWTQLDNDNAAGGASFNSTVYWKLAVAGDVSATNFTWNAGDALSPFCGGISAYRNVDQTSPIEGIASSADTTTTNPVTGTSLVTSNPSLVIHYRTIRVASATISTFSATGTGSANKRADFGNHGASTSYAMAWFDSAITVVAGTITGIAVTSTGTPTNAFSRTIGIQAAALDDSDVGTGTNAQSISATFSKAETSAATDAANVPNASLLSTDSGSGTEAQGPFRVLPLTDTTTTTELGTVQNSTSSSDSGSGTNAQSLVVNVSSSDATSTIEANSITANLSSSDSDTGTDAQSVFTGNNPTNSDIATGVEGQSVHVNLSSSDSFSGTDAQSVINNMVLSDSDSFTATDFGSIPAPPPVMPDTLVLGPGSVYLADFAAVEPTTTGTPNPAVWTDLGGILGGVDLTIAEDYDIIELVQMPDTQIRRLRKRYLTVKTQLAEPALQNLVFTLNDLTSNVVSGVGYNSYSASITMNESTPLTYRAVLVRGWKPGYTNNLQKRRTVILRKALSTDNVEISYTKDDQSVYTVTWSCHYVDGTTPPFKVIDEN